MIQKNYIKILPLSFPFTCDKAFWGNCVKEYNRIAPVFNRDGYYFDRSKNLCWIEVGGEAWKYSDRKNFEFLLNHSVGNNRIHPELYEAIGVVLSYGVNPRDLLKIYLTENMIRA